MGCMIYSFTEDHFVKCVCIICTHYGLGWEMQKVEKLRRAAVSLDWSPHFHGTPSCHQHI